MKELLFSVTASDCRWDYFKGSGAGGQKRNKTASAVRCTHLASGAVGKAEDTRSQHQNKRLAFVRMGTSDIFQKWARTEAARITGKLKETEEWVENELKINTRIDVKVDGSWQPWCEVNEV